MSHWLGRTLLCSRPMDTRTQDPPGAMVSMDYWNMLIPNTGNRTWKYRAASSSPASAQIPTATLLSTDGGSDTTFWNSTADGLYHVGSKTSAEGLLNFTDPLQELKFPCTFGTTWTDAMTASYLAGGIVPVTRIGSISGHADAYGTLRLPEGAEVLNALRVKVRRQINDNSAVADVVRIANVHYFYSLSMPYPMLQLTEDSVRIGTGAWTVVKGAQWIGNGFIVGLDESSLQEVAFSAYPNPVSEMLNIVIAGGEVFEAEVMDAAGHVVLQHRLSADRPSLDVRKLTPEPTSCVFGPREARRGSSVS
ncbi:MAG: hypothetical protein IPM46_10185 [Flavobacteriales bacterium]|nr:hypothetical protein [Flavobacteriales bacterium]